MISRNVIRTQTHKHMYGGREPNAIWWMIQWINRFNFIFNFKLYSIHECQTLETKIWYQMHDQMLTASISSIHFKFNFGVKFVMAQSTQNIICHQSVSSLNPPCKTYQCNFSCRQFLHVIVIFKFMQRIPTTPCECHSSLWSILVLGNVHAPFIIENGPKVRPITEQMRTENWWP